METDGTFTNHERRVQRVRQSILPRNGIENWQLLCQIAGRIGSRFRMKYKSASEITDEIRRVVPLYAGLDLDSGGDDSIWDIGKLALEPQAPTAATLVPAGPAATSRLRATLAFDHLERRFEQRFETLLERAREALPASGV